MYVQAVRDVDDIVGLLRLQPATLRAAIEPLSEAAGAARYGPGKWSIKEALGHMADTERVLAYRLLRVARGDETPLPGFDQDVFVRGATFDDRSLASLLTEFEAVRAATLALVDTLEPATHERRGLASDRPVSVRALVYIIAGHVQHHLRVLQERYGVGEAPGG
ncbi:MAG: DinB family protein [Gemmatimonadetes bacterium]|nr:DinB family protein [Gemmatimonadota bacterium]